MMNAAKPIDVCLSEIFAADPRTARRMVRDLVEKDDQNAPKWRWLLAFLACDSAQDRLRCIEDEIRQAPGNDVAQQALALYNARVRPS